MDWLIEKTMHIASAGFLAFGAITLATVDAGAIEKLVATFGTLIALAWYMYYNTKVTIPTINKIHTESSEKRDKLFTDSLKEEREARDRLTKEFRESLRDVTGTCRYREGE